MRRNLKAAMLIGLFFFPVLAQAQAIPAPAVTPAEPTTKPAELSEQDKLDLQNLKKLYNGAAGSADEQGKVVARAIELGPMGIDRVASLAHAEAKKAFDEYNKAFGLQATKLKDADAAKIVDSDDRVFSLRARLIKLATISSKLEVATGGKGFDPQVKLRELEESYLRQQKLGPVYSQLDDSEIKAIEETNKRRVENNLPPLEIDLKLTLTARDHSKDMAEHNFFAHESPIEGKKTFVDRALRFEGAANGENIFMGSPSAEVAVQAWMDSPGHRENILRTSFRRIGIGRYNNHWTQVFGN